MNKDRLKTFREVIIASNHDFTTSLATGLKPKPKSLDITFIPSKFKGNPFVPEVFNSEQDERDYRINILGEWIATGK